MEAVQGASLGTTETMVALGARVGAPGVGCAVRWQPQALAATGAGGVFLKPVKKKLITTPLPYRRTKTEEADDSCEDLGLTHLEKSDLDEGDPAVDTGAVSSDLSGCTTGSATDLSTDSEAPLKKVPATGGTVPATGGKPGTVPATGGKLDKPVKCGKSGPTIYDNGYFYIKGHVLDLKMHIHDQWLVDPPEGIGRTPQMTKTITPKTIGENRDDPVRSLQPQKDRLLGNRVASKLMRECVPDIVAKL